MIRVLVFGVFDGLHKGHKDFFRQARKLGDYLIAAVAPDSVIKKLKHHAPLYGLAARKKTIRDTGLVDEVVTGDSRPNSWFILGKTKPDIIALGYDQHSLKKALESHLEKNGRQIKIVELLPHKEKKYKSSLLNK